MKIFKFHNDAPILKYIQNSLKSCCLSSLAPDFVSTKQFKAANAISWQAKCTSAVVCSAGAVPLYSPPFPPSSFTKWYAWFDWPSLSLTLSITRGHVPDVTYEFRRVLRWPYVSPTRHFFGQCFQGCISSPLLCFGGMRTGWGGGFPPWHES